VEIEGVHPYHFHRTVCQSGHSFVDTWSVLGRRSGPDQTVGKKPRGKDQTVRSDIQEGATWQRSDGQI
jgi:hypothetical protein